MSVCLFVCVGGECLFAWVVVNFKRQMCEGVSQGSVHVCKSVYTVCQCHDSDEQLLPPKNVIMVDSLMGKCCEINLVLL